MLFRSYTTSPRAALSVPYKAGAGAGSGLGRGLDANDGTGPVAAALMLLQQLGASDDD